MKQILNIHKEHNKTCLECKKTFYVKPSKKGMFCSKSCHLTYRMKDGQASMMGKKSVYSQGEKRRSKNEIYFGELSKDKFKEVLFNEPIFNGWDADIIIPELKIAVLWNGKWHYQKITKQHSVEQVQNRDKIKQKEIEVAGYKSYVIQDLGKYKKEFVENKFKDFLVYLELN